MRAEQTSSAKIWSRMTLVGATVLQNFESWDPDTHQYEVAVLVCWSNNLCKAAMAVMTGNVLTTPSKEGKKKTVEEWLQEVDLAVVCGPRTYLDPSGQRDFWEYPHAQ